MRFDFSSPGAVRRPGKPLAISKANRFAIARHVIAIGLCVLFAAATARADAVLDWNAIAVNTLLSQTPPPNPFAQARFMAITQLAVFEAVNAISRRYDPYLGTVIEPSWASQDAAAISAAHTVLKAYFPGSAGALDTARANSLAVIPDGQAKTKGIEVGQAAAAAMMASRVNDGSTPLQFFMPTSAKPGEWQLTPSCPPAGGILYNWGNVTPFAIETTRDFIAEPPPSLTSRRYTKDYIEVMTVGGMNSPNRPQDRSDVARFYAATSPSNLLNSAARQVSTAQGRSLVHNARALALINMAINDSLVTSFATKYVYNFWRPETAIRNGDLDGNPKTDPDPNFVPFITTPCFPSYGSNHASGSYGGSEVLTRLYGEGGHAITITNPAVPGIVLHYTTFKQICQDVDDARVFGGIHFRFDQEAGARIGRGIGTYVVKHTLRRARERDDKK